MKTPPFAAVLVLCCAGCASDRPEDLRRAAREGVFPATLASDEAALAYTRGFFVGGHVEKVRIGLTSYLVVFEHGSGLPIIRIGVYRRIVGRWQLVASPEFGRGEDLKVETSDGKIFVRGLHSKQTWLIFDPDKTR
jgi:hypothetical protein